MENKELIIHNPNTQPLIEMSEKDYQLAVRQYLTANNQTLNDQELKMFVTLCYMHQLNPLKGEVFAVKYDQTKFQVLVSYKVYVTRVANLKLLERYDTEIQIDEKTKLPTVGKLTIKRKDQDFEHNLYYYFNEWAQKSYSRTTGAFELSATWKSKPFFMFRKCILSNGFREVFPEVLSTLPYTVEEDWTNSAPQEQTINRNLQRMQLLEKIKQQNENVIKEQTDETQSEVVSQIRQAGDDQ